MMLFDIGANRGDAVFAGLQKGFDRIIALEPAPRIFRELVANFLYAPEVTPLKLAVSDSVDVTVEFHEAEEDGLSTLNVDWLTSETLPYNGKPFRTIRATTISVDKLVELYGKPDLMKIDVEGAEWSVFRGMSKYYGMLTFEWTQETLPEHDAQLEYLKGLGYTEFAPQFIVHHLDEPTVWYPLDGAKTLTQWRAENAGEWEKTGWKVANLRPTSDVGMCWVR